MFKKIRKLLGRFRSFLHYTKCEEEYFIEVLEGQYTLVHKYFLYDCTNIEYLRRYTFIQAPSENYWYSWPTRHTMKEIKEACKDMGITPSLIMSDGRRILRADWEKEDEDVEVKIETSGHVDITTDMWWAAFTQGYAPPAPAVWWNNTTTSINNE